MIPFISLQTFYFACLLFAYYSSAENINSSLHSFQPRASKDFQPSNCTNFGDDFIKLVTAEPTLMREVNSTCLSLIPPDTIARLGPLQVANLLRTENRIQVCAGFTPTGIAALTVDAFNGMTTNCFRNILPSSLANISNPAIITALEATISGNVCSAFNATQLSALQNEVYQGFTDICIARISVAAIVGMNSAEKTKNLVYVSPDNYQVCRGFSSNQIAVLPPAAFAGFNADCQFAIQSRSFSAVNSTKSVEAFEPDGCSGISAPQMQVLDVSLYSSITADCFLAISREGIGGINTSQKLNSLSLDVFIQMNYTQIAGLNGITFSELAHDRWLIWVDNLADNEIHPCYGFTGDQLRQLPAAYFQDITRECWVSLQADAFTFLNENQVGLVPAGLWSEVIAPQFRAIGPFAVYNFPEFATFGSAIPRNSTRHPCLGVTRDQSSRFTFTTFQAFAKTCDGLTPLTIQTTASSAESMQFSMLISYIFLVAIASATAAI